MFKSLLATIRHRVAAMAVSALCLTLLAAPVLARAADESAGSSQKLENPLGKVTDIPTILGNVMRAGFGILGSIALLMFIYGGFRWLTSGGNPESIKKGQDTMVWAILGIAIIFASYAIVSFVISALTKT